MATDDLTDRDRLALAFDELRTRGYVADVTIGYRMCCRDCALTEIAKQTNEVDEDGDLVLPEKFVFWHTQKDDWSFVGQSGFPMPEDFRDKPEEWWDENTHLIEARMLDLRTSDYVWLVNPLNLHWLGNADEIVGVLRNHGLQCSVPNSDHWCIEVLPTRKSADLPINA